MKFIPKNVIRTGSLILIALFVFQIKGFAKCVYKSPLRIQVQEIGNMLKWSTAEEQNIAFFIIEKSNDGIDFQEIGNVKGAGHSQKITKYRFLDFCLPEAKTYYRLLHYAPDGSYTTSATFYLENSSKNDMKILAASSTLTNTKLGLTLASKKEVTVNYEVKDASGRTVFSGTQDLTVGKNTLDINCHAFQNGKYDVVLKTGTDQDKITIHKVDEEKVPNVEFVVVN